MAGTLDTSIPQGFLRTTGLISSGNYSASWWAHIGSAPSSGNQSLFYLGDDPQTLYDQYIWIGRGATGGFYIEVRKTTTVTGTNATAPVAGLHFFTYTRTGSTHKLFMDFVQVGTTVTKSISGFAPTHLYLGTDTFTEDAVGTTKYAAFKEFSIVLTANQQEKEARSAALVTSALAGSLITATPLSTTLSATTGTGWANVGSATFSAMSPANFLAEFATVLTVPSTVVQDPLWTRAILWFTATAPTNATGISVMGLTDTGINYYPLTMLIPSVDADSVPGYQAPTQAPTVPGAVWLVQVKTTGPIADPLGGVLTINVAALTSALPRGAIIVPADSSAPLIGTAVIDIDTGTVAVLKSMGSGEYGDSLLAPGYGQMALHSRGTKNIGIWDRNYSLITVLSLDSDTDWDPIFTDIPVIANIAGTSWYTLAPLTTPNTGRLYHIAADGAVVERWGPINNVPPTQTKPIAVSVDESTLYYVDYDIVGATLPMYGWDLGSDTSLGLLFTLTRTSSVYHWVDVMLALPDGSLLVAENTAADTLVDNYVYRVAADGSLLQTYILPQTSSRFFINKINRGETFDTFWVWSQSKAVATGFFEQRFTEIDVATGMVRNIIEAPPFSIVPDPGAEMFNIPASCPFFLALGSGAGSGSGPIGAIGPLLWAEFTFPGSG